jgi:acetylornithine/N-succinyldiaminopimelate aminotransferase
LAAWQGGFFALQGCMSASNATPLPSADARSPHAAEVMATYARQNLVFERGEGAWLTTTTGARYLDFGSGVAVNALGHAHPRLVAALTAQAQKLWHTSNLYRVAGQEDLARRLGELTFAERVFFCNSGAEACEGAIKVARRAHFTAGRPERVRIITFAGAFHGRTLTALAAAGNAKYLEGFGPPAEGFDQVTFLDTDAAEAIIGPETAAIMVEPIQGEGGVHVATPDFLRALRGLCDRYGLYLILDEVQSGMGRSGKLFAHEWAGITPDVMAVAKGIGGGFPVGAILTTATIAEGMTPGTHGSTYGGNPLAMAVAGEVLSIVSEPAFLEGIQNKALRLKQSLAGLKDGFPDIIEEVRGQGLLVGIKVKPPAAEVVKAAIAEKLLLVGAADNTVRILPPLNVTDDEIAEGIARLSRACAALAETVNT